MINILAKPFSEKVILKDLGEDVKEWFTKKYETFSPPQRFLVKLINDHKNMLIYSPTVTGKTLAAFLEVINRLVKYAKKDKLENRVYCVFLN